MRVLSLTLLHAPTHPSIHAQGSMGGQQGSSEPDQKLLELQEVFRPENVFRNPRDPYPKIEFSIRFKTITSVEPDSEIFGANVEMVLSWQITKQDAANFIACVNRAAWKPASFEPPELAVVNPALGTSACAQPVQLLPSVPPPSPPPPLTSRRRGFLGARHSSGDRPC